MVQIAAQPMWINFFSLFKGPREKPAAYENDRVNFINADLHGYRV